MVAASKLCLLRHVPFLTADPWGLFRVIKLIMAGQGGERGSGSRGNATDNVHPQSFELGLENTNIWKDHNALWKNYCSAAGGNSEFCGTTAARWSY